MVEDYGQPLPEEAIILKYPLLLLPVLTLLVVPPLPAAIIIIIIIIMTPSFHTTFHRQYRV
jgi:hypothetical protein